MRDRPLLRRTVRAIVTRCRSAVAWARLFGAIVSVVIEPVRLRKLCA